MLSARFFSASGEPGETRQLPQDPFDGIVHEAALHQVIKAYLANQRQGTASTKTRANVAGGGRKAWRQKGTGRARQGSIRAPHWRGGGIVFGPHPRDHHQDVPKKLKALARRSAFNTRALAEQVTLIESFGGVTEPKTRRVVELLDRMGFGEAKVLLLTRDINTALYLSTRNLQNVKVLPYAQASAYDVMHAGQLVIEADALNAPVAAAATEVENA
jgi:large subunit ribosomal protein L4